MCDILTEQLQHYTVLWRETSALYEEWAKRHALSYYELLVILSIMNPDGPCLQKDICTHWQLPKQTVNTILKTLPGAAGSRLYLLQKTGGAGSFCQPAQAGYSWKQPFPTCRLMKNLSGRGWDRRMPGHC